MECKTNSWEQEEGVYKISVGRSSEDIVLSDEITLKGTTDKKPYDMSELSIMSQVMYKMSVKMNLQNFLDMKYRMENLISAVI